MDTQFFLAANTGRGFVSCQEDFPPPGVFLHILKGGPGNGKSGFMRRIRKAAQARGMDTETILCSGDPDSLDGLYLPALHQAWVDGTAPHAREPKCFGVDANYVNLGRFCSLPAAGEVPDAIREKQAQYQAEYRAAYALLAGALALRRAGEKGPESGSALRAEQSLAALLPERGNRERGSITRRFLSANSCQGFLTLKETKEKLCKQNYELPGGPDSLCAAADTAARRGFDAVLCLDPLDGERPEALLIPALSLAFTAPTETVVEYRKQSETLRSLACERLRQAKALHDELERLYALCVDFAALTDFTERSLERLFGTEG